MTFLITWHRDPAAWRNFQVALISAGVVLALFASLHFLRSPWLTHTQIVEGDKPIHSAYGVLGMLTMVGLLAVPTFLWYYLRPLQQMVVTATVPCPAISPVRVTVAPTQPAEAGPQIIQHGAGNKANPITIRGNVKQGGANSPCQANAIGGSATVNDSCNTTPPERKLSKAQQKEFADSLRASCPFTVAVHPIAGNGENAKYAEQIIGAVQSAGCSTWIPHNILDSGAFSGVAVSVADIDHPPQQAIAVEAAFRAAGIFPVRQQGYFGPSEYVYVIVGLNDSK